MGTRILVTGKFPGEGEDKITQMANRCCRKLWDRDFDSSRDRLYHEGNYTAAHQRGYLLIDVGSVEGAYNILWYRWENETLYLFYTVPLSMPNSL